MCVVNSRYFSGMLTLRLLALFAESGTTEETVKDVQRPFVCLIDGQCLDIHFLSLSSFGSFCFYTFPLCVYLHSPFSAHILSNFRRNLNIIYLESSNQALHHISTVIGKQFTVHCQEDEYKCAIARTTKAVAYMNIYVTMSYVVCVLGL